CQIVLQYTPPPPVSKGAIKKVVWELLGHGKKDLNTSENDSSYVEMFSKSESPSKQKHGISDVTRDGVSNGQNGEESDEEEGKNNVGGRENSQDESESDEDQEIPEKAAKASDELLRSKAKKKKKDFLIELKDIHEDISGSKKKGKGRDVRTKKKKRTSNSSEDDGELDVKSLRKEEYKSKWSNSQGVARLWEVNKCDEHTGKACLKLVDHHYTLTTKDLSSWAHMMSCGYQSLTSPPPQLAIGDKKSAPQTPAIPHPEASTSVAERLGQAVQYQAPFPMPFMPYPMMPPSKWSSYSHALTPLCSHHDIPSSDPPDVSEDVKLFPLISDWLVDLDNDDHHGRDGHNFAEWAEFFQKQK
ncbi:hypothetical protein H0H81_000713, partial [Sphagnurus paluster]